MTDIEEIKAEIERQIKEECPLDTYEGRCKSCWANTLLTFANSIIEDQPQGLDEAAENYLKHHIYGGEGKPEVSVLTNFAKAAFKAGAKWDASQGVTLSGEICIPNAFTESKEGEELVVRATLSKDVGYKFGDKVIVQIRKKED